MSAKGICSRASPGCFPLGSPCWSVPRAGCSILHLCPLPLYPLLEAEAVVGPVPTSPQMEESQKETHGIFLIIFTAWQVDNMQAGWNKKSQLSAPSSAVSVKSCWIVASPGQTLPRALLPANSKQGTPQKLLSAAALGRFPDLEAEGAFPPLWAENRGKCQQGLEEVFIPLAPQEDLVGFNPLHNSLLSLLSQLCKLCLGGEPRHSRRPGARVHLSPFSQSCASGMGLMSVSC